jgi:beta-N-acetylhexosaminidase
MAATAKHFPGKGAATVDAHEDLPFVSSSEEEIDQIHLKPFRGAIEAGVSFIMTSHVVYRNLDKDFPVTFSKRIVQEVLRKRLSFENVILSDDLEMGAIIKRFSFEEAVIRAVEAGHDLVLICHQPDLIRRGYRALESAYRDGRLDPKNLEKSLSRLKKVLKRFETSEEAVSDGDGWTLACEIARSSVELVQSGNFFTFQSAEKKEMVIFVPHFNELVDRFYFENALLEKESIFIKSFKDCGQPVKEIRFHLTGDFVATNFDSISSDLPAILFCFDAKNFQAQREMLISFQKKIKHGAVVLLRNPYDAQYIQGETTYIQTYGFRTPQIQRAIEILCEPRNRRS